jgi:hypothetical protein
MIDNKKLVYIGLAALGVLIVYSSTRKPKLQEVKGTQDQKSFDNSVLPIQLKPPYKMAEGDKFPTLNVKKVIGLSIKPRFDAL